MNKLFQCVPALFLLTILGLPVIALMQPTQKSLLQKTSYTVASDSFNFKIIESPGNTFGYDIYKFQRLIIHQPAVPCLAGNAGFRSKADAGKTAKLVISKLKQGQTLPGISLKELKDIGVAY